MLCAVVGWVQVEQSKAEVDKLQKTTHNVQTEITQVCICVHMIGSVCAHVMAHDVCMSHDVHVTCHVMCACHMSLLVLSSLACLVALLGTLGSARMAVAQEATQPVLTVPSGKS